jgi:cyclophilin family peptidyl-prolyl cis-trans isomerase
MVTLGSIGILLASLASAAPDAVDHAALAPVRLYNGVGRSIEIRLAPPPSIEPVTLVLMDAGGGLLAEPVDLPAREHVVDLAPLMPELERLRRAAYLQLMVDDRPLDSALVLQPMLSRMVPVAEDAVSPSGIRYTRIVDWRDEYRAEQSDAAANDEGTPEVAGDDADREGAKREETPRVDEQTDDVTSMTPWLAPSGGDGRLFTGLRIYIERDVILDTTHGEIRIALRPDIAPNTAWNFRRLCEGGFYRAVPFHRIVPMTREGEPFVIQAGDPSTTGSGGPGYWLPIEPSILPHDFGVISMARDVDPDSAGSQFFICLSRAGTARLDGHYCAFGYAVSGRETILSIADVELADVKSGRPADPPIIRDAELIPAPPRTPGVGRPDQRVEREPPEEGGEAKPKPGRVPR